MYRPLDEFKYILHVMKRLHVPLFDDDPVTPERIQGSPAPWAVVPSEPIIAEGP